MRYCLSGNQTEEYIKKADELKLELKQLDKVLNIYEINPDASIIIDIPFDTGEIEIDWSKIEQYNKMLRNKLIIGTSNKKYMEIAKEYDIKFYYTVPITTFYDLQALKEYGSYYALIDAPLTNMLDKILNIDIKIRVVPNVAYYALIPRKDGILGSWIRPEDMVLYEKYVDTVEFEDCDLKKERALYRIYNEQKKWPGDLDLLITNFGYTCNGSLIAGKALEKRLTCGQVCQSGGACHICYRLIQLATTKTYKEI